MRTFTHSLLLGTLLLMTACGEPTSPEEPTKPTAAEKPAVKAPTPAPTATPAATAAHGHSNGIQPTISTSLSLANVTLNIAGQGTLKPMSQYRFNIGLVAGTPGAIVRLWIGEESGVGSVKSKANGHGDHYHASAIVPKEVNEKTALWIEVQSVTGERETARIALQ